VNESLAEMAKKPEYKEYTPYWFKGVSCEGVLSPRKFEEGEVVSCSPVYDVPFICKGKYLVAQIDVEDHIESWIKLKLGCLQKDIPAIKKRIEEELKCSERDYWASVSTSKYPDYDAIREYYLARGWKRKKDHILPLVMTKEIVEGVEKVIIVLPENEGGIREYIGWKGDQLIGAPISNSKPKGVGRYISREEFADICTESGL
jgi:hypothetical protein